MRNNKLKLVLLLFFVSIVSIIEGCARKRSFQDNLNSATNIVISDSSFVEKLDFTQLLKYELIAPGNKTAIVNANIVFVNCIFDKTVTVYKNTGKHTYSTEFKRNLVFANCIFQDTLQLSHAVVNGDLILKGSKFAGPIVINNTWLKGLKNNLNKTEFLGQFNISGTVIDNGISFKNAVFGQAVNAYGAIFKGYANFGGCTFEEYTSFDKSTFKGFADFSMSAFNHTASFSNVKFGPETSFRQSQFNKNNHFSGSVFIGICDFRGSHLTQPIDTSSVNLIFNITEELK